MSGSYTTNNWFYNPDYGAYGPADWARFTAAQEAADLEIEALDTAQTALNTLVTGWAVMENQDILIPNCSYSDADTFIVTGADLTAKFTAGKYVRAKLGDNTYKGSTVASSSYGGGNTTVNLNDAILTNPIGGIWLTATRDGTFPYGPGYVVARDYGVPGQTALAAAIAAIGILERTLVLTPGTWAISADTTVPANITLKCERGAILEIATTKTLTINGHLEAGLYQIFSCTGTGKVVFGNGAVDWALPQWWYSGSGSWHTAINAAIASGYGSWCHVGLVGEMEVTGAIVFDKPRGGEIRGLGYAKITNTGTTDTFLLDFNDVAPSPYNGVLRLSKFNVFGNASSGRGIYITRTDGPVLEDIYFKTHGKEAVLVDDGATGNGSSSVRLVRCRADDLGLSGTYSAYKFSTNSHNFSVIDCSAGTATQFGLYVTDVANGGTIVNFAGEYNVLGQVKLAACRGTTYVGGYLEDNHAVPMMQLDTCDGVDVTGVDFLGDGANTTYAITATGCTGGRIQSNNIEGPAGANGFTVSGIDISSSCSKMIIGPNKNTSTTPLTKGTGANIHFDLLVGDIASGTYVPTCAAVTNVTSVNPFTWNYLRVGNVATVSGRVEAQPTGAGNAIFSATLPIAAAISAGEKAGGTGAWSTIGGEAIGVHGYAGQGKVYFRWQAVDTANKGMTFSFTYLID